MTLFYAGRTYNRESLDVIYEFAQDTNTPFDWWCCLGYGESGLNDQEVHGDGGLSRGVFQVYTPVHGLPPHGWLGPEGTRAAMRHLWQNRWRHYWELAGGDSAWLTWTGQREVARYFLTRPVYDQGRILPPDPCAPPVGRAAALYWWWPHFQGSIRPSWRRACEVEAMGTAVALYYLETRSRDQGQDPRLPHLVGALDVARQEVRAAVQELDAARSRLLALGTGIDQALA